MNRIFIIGYMGAGKTTVGKALAKELNIEFYDLDWYIEARMRKTVKQIFDEQGEEGFRRIEKNMLHMLTQMLVNGLLREQVYIMFPLILL